MEKNLRHSNRTEQNRTYRMPYGYGYGLTRNLHKSKHKSDFTDNYAEKQKAKDIYLAGACLFSGSVDAMRGVFE